MTVTVTVEDGTVVTNANSYVSVAEATSYLSVNPHVSATWVALTSDERANLVIFASRYIDQRAVWRGWKTDDDSAMRWPRTGVYDRDGILISPNVIPQQLKDAVCEMARFLLVDDLGVPRDQDGLWRIKVDVIELQFNRNYTLPSVPSMINQILQGIGSLMGGAYGFGKISRA